MAELRRTASMFLSVSLETKGCQVSKGSGLREEAAAEREEVVWSRLGSVLPKLSLKKKTEDLSCK